MKNIYIPIIILVIFGLSFWLLKNKNIEDNNMTTENTTEKEIVNVTLNTSLGEIKLEMYPEEAPKTVQNFVKLSKDGFYDGKNFTELFLIL